MHHTVLLQKPSGGLVTSSRKRQHMCLIARHLFPSGSKLAKQFREILATSIVCAFLSACTCMTSRLVSLTLSNREEEIVAQCLESHSNKNVSTYSTLLG